MLTFSEYLEEERQKKNLLDCIVFMAENDETLNESAKDMGRYLNKLGFQSSGGFRTSLLGYLGRASAGVAKMIYYAIKGDRNKVKELASSVSKEEIIDFVLKVDKGTLGFLDQVFDKIEAWAGYEIAPNVRKKVKDVKKTVIELSSELKQYLVDLFDTQTASQFLKYLDQIIISITGAPPNSVR